MSKPKALFIAEKGSVARAVKETCEKFGDKIPYEITGFLSQSGHLLTLKLPNELGGNNEKNKYHPLPIFPDELGGWEYKFTGDREKGLYAKIKAAITDKDNHYDLIIHAGDSDREGQLLVDIVLERIKAEKYISEIKRFWNNDLTHENIIECLNNMEDGKSQKYVNLSKSGVFRQHIDYLFGMNGSSAARSITGEREALGRVKTAAQNMVVQREIEIANFKTAYSYGILANNLFSECDVKCEYCTKEIDDKGKVNYSPFFFDLEEDAKDLANNLNNTSKKLIVENVTKKVVKVLAPPLFKMSILQAEMNTKYGMRSDLVSDKLQEMYLAKILTYPRTTCPLISKNTDFTTILKNMSLLPELGAFAKQVTAEDIERVKKTPTYVDEVEMAKHGHTGLSPTINAAVLDSLDEDSKKIYLAICERFISIFLKPISLERTNVILVNKELEEECYFKINGKKVIDKGFLNLTGGNSEDVIIPNVTKGEVLNPEEYGISTRQTTCPKRYDGASLILAMENPNRFIENAELRKAHKKMSLGTEATRAAIIKTLIEKDKYLKYEKKKGSKNEYIIPTEKGFALIEGLKGLDLLKIDCSARWEELIDNIAHGNMSLEDAEKESKEAIKKLVADISEKKIKGISSSSGKSGSSSGKGKKICICAKCQESIIEGANNYYCNNYKASTPCTVSFPKKYMAAKNNITPAIAKKLLEGKETVSLNVTSKGGNNWNQKIKYNFETGKIDFVK